MTNDRRIALVLGSGGARGLAHIGVIRCLEDHGFDIRYIAGSSIGALVGGIYAAGKLEVYAEWVCALQRRDVMRLLDWSFRRGALFTGERLIRQLKALVGERNIEDLSVGFTAVATELNDKREIWLSRGPLWDAVRPSIAIPMIFTPVQHDGLLLVDGGLVNPVPIAPTLNDPTLWTVAVDLNGRAEPLEGGAGSDGDEPFSDQMDHRRHRIARFLDGLMPKAEEEEIPIPSVFELALRSMDAMQTTIARMKLAAYSPKLLIEIPRNLCTFFEFHRARDLIDFGYRRAQETLQRAGY